MQSSAPPNRVSFGLFEVDLKAEELYKAGFRVKLQSQPFRVLMALLEHPGEVVTREELQLRLWGKDTTVDFDHSLGTAVNKIREALGDSADNPRFVETLARRGYRFIAPVTVIDVQLATPVVVHTTTTSIESAPLELTKAVTIKQAAPSLAGHVTPRFFSSIYAYLGAAAIAVLGIGGALLLSRRSAPTNPPALRQITESGNILPGSAAMESFPATVTDGTYLYTSAIQDGRPIVARISVHGGETAPLFLPDEVAGPSIADISADRTRLLLRSHLSNESEQPLWIAPVGGGSAQRIPNIVAHDATWMPGGEDILLAAGNELRILNTSSGSIKTFAKLPGRAFWLRWSPDGKLLRFTVFDPVSHTESLWETAAESSKPHLLLPGWNGNVNVCCGVWSETGDNFVFQAVRSNGIADLWQKRGRSTSMLTNGPMSFQSPTLARDGATAFFTGVSMQSGVQSLDPQRHEFESVQPFLRRASRLEYSHDGQWLAWTDTDGRLWRARPDGNEKLQLSPDSMQVFLARWSPDGSRLALMAREPSKAWQIYLVRADGSALTQVLSDGHNEADPTWSPDGKSLIFGGVPDLMGREDTLRTIRKIDLQTRTVETLPNSEDLFSPRWSADGRYVVAMTLDQRSLMLFDMSTKSWRQLAKGSFADPVWASDGRSIFTHGFMEADQPIRRVSLDGRVEVIASLANARAENVVDYFFCGLMPGDVPAVRTRSGAANLYSLDIKH